MPNASFLGMGVGTLAAGTAVAAVIGIVGYQVVFAPDADAPVVSEDISPIAETVIDPEPPVEVAETEPAPTVEAQESAAVETAPEPIEIPEMLAPSFDLVRVDAAGGAVIAGQGEPNADLRLVLDGRELDLVSTDGAGSFVSMITLPASTNPQVLSLEMLLADGGTMRSDQSVIISPIMAEEAAPEGEPSTLLAEATPDEDPVELALAETAPVQLPQPVSPGTPELPEAPVLGEIARAPAVEAAPEPETAPIAAVPSEAESEAVAESVAESEEPEAPVVPVTDLASVTPEPRPETAQVTPVETATLDVPATALEIAEAPESVVELIEEVASAETPATVPVETPEIVIAEPATVEPDPVVADVLTELAELPNEAPAIEAPSAEAVVETAAVEVLENTTELSAAPIVELSAAETETPEFVGPQETAPVTAEAELGESTEIAMLETPASDAPGADQPASPPSEDMAQDSVIVPEAPSAEDSGAVETASAEPEETPAAPQAPTVLIADSNGVRVVQSGPGQAPSVQSQIVLDTISYDTEGEVILSGRGPADSDVRFYLDNQPIQLAAINAIGAWRADLPLVDPGTYVLRLDEVDASGEVQSRIEGPFQREDPEIIASLPANSDGEVVTVQWGNTLWGIAQQYLGEGVAYVQVYEANRDLIRDPDLIYPGQVFAIPETDRTE